MISASKNSEIYQDIPTWDNGTWTKTSFSSREEFCLFLESDYFKEPGEYAFDKTAFLFNEKGRFFKENDYYCEHLEGSLDFEDWWDFEKLKCRKGVFFINGENKWYLPRDYYMWINYLPIMHKVTKKLQFPTVYDTQLHVALYECIGELKYKHGVILKKRQFGSSFLHVAKLVNYLWFEQGAVLKIGASLDIYLTGVNGSWKMAETYRSFLNQHTAWYRPMNPGSVGSWEQKLEVNENGKTYYVGTKGTLQSISFQQSDTAGVGGLTSIFFYEEAGIAKSMDKTYEFLRPAMEDGDITTGYFIASGSVGDLKQCKPLKTFMYKPAENGFYAVRNRWVNEKRTVLYTGLFIPEQYSMPPYIDEFGNSLVDEALESLFKKREEWKRDLDSEIYQLRVSQHPIYMDEAFASREDSIFPLALVDGHVLDIEDGEYGYELVELDRGIDGKITGKPTMKPPIKDFPVDKKTEDKTGSIVVWERPMEKPEWGTYYASVDPVAVGKTNSSVSLCSIYVYKNPIEVTKYEDGKYKTYIEGDKIVASWCGRFDDINKTHERLEMIIEWYNAWTLVENNVSLFIIHMITVKKQKYLVPKNQIVFLKELSSNEQVFAEYGWKNTGSIFQKNMLPYLIEYLKEVIYEEFDELGAPIKSTYGITRIPDIMAMEEIKAYQPGLNVDRLIALAALITFVKLQHANKGNKKRFETEDVEYLENSDKIYKLKSTPFKNLGRSSSNIKSNNQRSPFRRLK